MHFEMLDKGLCVGHISATETSLCEGIMFLGNWETCYIQRHNFVDVVMMKARFFEWVSVYWNVAGLR